MKARRNRSGSWLVLATVLGFLSLAAAGEESAIDRGRKIYLSGVPADDAPLVASVGQPAMEVTASILKCVNCHRRDGRGQTEGGITPANIRWDALSRASGDSPAGRRRDAYSDKLLIRAITTGLDASGQRLDPAMPRYRLTHGQAGDLVAYLGVLGRETDPGVTDTSLQIGVVLPPAGMPGASATMRAVLEAFARQANAQGGVFGRQLQLSFITAPDEVSARAGAIRDFVETGKPFALIACYLIGCEQEIGPYLEENEVPLIGPIALYAGGAAAEHRHLFHLLAGLVGQGQALARFATQRPDLSRPSTFLVRREGDEQMLPVVAAIGKYLTASGWNPPRDVLVAGMTEPDWKTLLSGDGARAVFWFAPPEGLEAFYRAAAGADPRPILFAPSALVGRELLAAPPDFAGRVFCSFPVLPSDQTPLGRGEILALARDTPFADSSFARIALSSAKLLAAGLRQAGRDVSREKLVEILESFSSFVTGQTPAVTFGPQRRMGADGAYVSGVDLQQKSPILPATWVSVP